MVCILEIAFTTVNKIYISFNETDIIIIHCYYLWPKAGRSNVIPFFFTIYYTSNVMNLPNNKRSGAYPIGYHLPSETD